MTLVALVVVVIVVVMVVIVAVGGNTTDKYTSGVLGVPLEVFQEGLRMRAEYRSIRTFVFLMLRTYVMILCNWLIL